jgi:predicted peptidase
MLRRVRISGGALLAGLLVLWAYAPGALVGEVVKPARPKKTGFIERTYADEDGEYKYVVFIPHDSYTQDGDKQYPVILFLHGHGLEGTDGWKPTHVGLGPAIRADEKAFDFIAVFPQSRERWEAGSDDSVRALAILDEVMEVYPSCDPDKVSVAGYSQGGHGAWCQAVADPSRWAAMVVVAGFPGDLLGEAEKIKDIASWFFHGEKDKTVHIGKAKKMVGALKEAGGDPEHTWDPDGAHNRDWFNEVFANTDLYDWLRKQSRE